MWLAFQLDPRAKTREHYFRAAARLNRSVTVEQAAARLQVARERIPREVSNALQPNQGFSVTLFQKPSSERAVVFAGARRCCQPGAPDRVRKRGEPAARALTGLKREIAIHSAIGADRGYIVRQLLTESVVLSLAGGALDRYSASPAFTRCWRSTPPTCRASAMTVPSSAPIGACCCLHWWWRSAPASSLVLIPALQGSRADLAGTLKESGGPSGSGFKQGKGALGSGRRRSGSRARAA